MAKDLNIKKAFKEAGLFVDAVYKIDGNEILVCISWGEREREHLACVQLMRRLGLVLVQTVITENYGADRYSAEHLFVKP